MKKIGIAVALMILLTGCGSKKTEKNQTSVPDVVVADATDASADDSGWKEGFAELIADSESCLDSSGDQKNSYALVWIDDNDQPELWISCDGDRAYDKVVAYDGETCRENLLTGTQTTYIERSGMMFNDYEEAGCRIFSLMELCDGRFSCLCSADYRRINFVLGGEDTSATECLEAISVYDTEQAVRPQEMLSAEDMIALLEE